MMQTPLLRSLPPALARYLGGARQWRPALVATMLSAATALAFAMAMLGAINDRPELWRGPPDEYGHRSAARYYMDHWLPPKVGEAASLDSYSRDYGYSYLNDTDLVYLFAGKFAALASPVVANHDLAFRLFNVLLLAILACLCWLRPAAWLVFTPLLLSPQVWYIFSYFNGDAFPLFLSVAIACQVTQPGSLFNKCLDSPGLPGKLSGALLVGILVGLLALSKKNYYAFLAMLPAAIAIARLGLPGAVLLAASAIGGAAWYLGWFAMEETALRALAAGATLAVLASMFRDPATRRARAVILAKCAATAIVALAIVASRHAMDVAANGPPEEKRLALGVVQEELAKPEYKPSQIYSGTPGGGYYGINLRARGTELGELFAPPWNWHIKTFTSAIGQYGWLEFTGPKAYFAAMALAYAALFALYLRAAVQSSGIAARVDLFVVVTFACLTLAIAIYHSWANDFQAQGRYLFPIVAMLGIGFQSTRGAMGAPAPFAAIVACFALSAWSFIFIGLWQIPRSF